VINLNETLGRIDTEAPEEELLGVDDNPEKKGMWLDLKKEGSVYQDKEIPHEERIVIMNEKKHKIQNLDRI